MEGRREGREGKGGRQGRKVRMLSLPKAVLIISINFTGSPFAQGGRITLEMEVPSVFSPKFKLFGFSKISGLVYSSGI
jgi:hypothetical protein